MRPIERADILGNLHHIARIRCGLGLKGRESGFNLRQPLEDRRVDMPLADRILEMQALTLQIADRCFPGRDPLRRALRLLGQVAGIILPELRDSRIGQDVGDYTLMGVEMGEEAEAATPEVSAPNFYEEAVLERAPHHLGELHELPKEVLVSYVERVAEVEGPTHVDEVVTRIREAWGLKRAGARIRDAIGAAVDVAARKGSIIRDGDFIFLDGRQAVLRDRFLVSSPGLRKPEAIPLDEIAAGAMALAAANYGAPVDQLVTEIARGLGFKATSDGLKRRIAEGIELAQRDGRLEEQNGLLQAVSAPVETG